LFGYSFSRLSSHRDSHYSFGSTSKGNYTSSFNQPPPINASPEMKLKYENKKAENEIELLHIANNK